MQANRAYKAEEQALQQEMDEIMAAVEETESTESETSATTEAPQVDPMVKNVRVLKERYPQVVAWVHVPCTDINFPVVQGDDSFYLTHNYKNEPHKFGAVFMAHNNDPALTDQNTVIYGHNIRSGKIFYDLMQYQDPNFVKEHDTIELVTPEKKYVYTIVAAMEVVPTLDYREPEYTGTDFQDYHARILEHSVLDAFPVTEDNHLLTLSTCAMDDDRFVVIGTLESEH